MARIVLFAVLMVLTTSSMSIAGVMSDAYVFPVVVRSEGAANSFWKTELCLNNPRPEELTLWLGIFQGGGVEQLLTVELDGWEVLCSDDFLWHWLGYTDWTGALFVVAPEDENYSIDSRYFSASARVYNDQPQGTLGLNIEPEVDPGWYQGSRLEDPSRFGTVSGLRNYGILGVSGFRTSVGFFNAMEAGEMITIMAYDSGGNVDWEKDLWVPGFTQIQLAVPKSVSITYGGVDAHKEGDQWVLSYMTVTDNRSGDGLYRPNQLLYQGMQKSSDRRATDVLEKKCRELRASGKQRTLPQK